MAVIEWIFGFLVELFVYSIPNFHFLAVVIGCQNPYDNGFFSALVFN